MDFRSELKPPTRRDWIVLAVVVLVLAVAAWLARDVVLPDLIDVR